MRVWKWALAGILITNPTVDEATATEADKLFFEVIIAPAFDDAALDILKKKKNRNSFLKNWELIPLLLINLPY